MDREFEHAIALLIQSDQLEQAAELAEKTGHPRRACDLWEQACRWDRAATAALAAGDFRRGTLLAVRSGDMELRTRAIARLVEEQALAAMLAGELHARGDYMAAAELYAAIDDFQNAARSAEQAAAWFEAARYHERAGRADAARNAYQMAIDRDQHSALARLRLGMSFAAAAAHERAIAAWQKIEPSQPEYAPAMRRMAHAFEQLNMPEAARSVRARSEAGGGRDDEHAHDDEHSPLAEQKLEGPLLFGRYEVLALIASSYTARVYRARDRLDGSTVALKLLAAEALRDGGRDARQRFEREAMVLERLRHPHVVPLLAYHREGPALVLRWMAGGSLFDQLAPRMLTVARVVEVAEALLLALGEAHRRGVLHRDLKPTNVLFDQAGAPYLSDFGMAHFSDLGATATVGVGGTIGYVAPEVRQGEPATPASDVYGVGAILWYALTGTTPDVATQLPRVLDSPQQAAVRALVAPRGERPADPASALRRLRSLSWPAEPANLVQPSPAPEAPGHRWSSLPGGRYLDQWLGREVELVELEPAGLAAAQARFGPRILAYYPAERRLCLELIPGLLARERS